MLGSHQVLVLKQLLLFLTQGCRCVHTRFQSLIGSRVRDLVPTGEERRGGGRGGGEVRRRGKERGREESREESREGAKREERRDCYISE